MGDPAVRRILSCLLALLFVAAGAAPAAPVVAHILTPARPGKWLWTVMLALLIGERVWAMFFRMRARVSTSVDRDWTAVAVGYAYAAVVYLSIADFYLRIRLLTPWPLAATGLVLYGSGVALRYWAFGHLRHQWSIHVDRPMQNRLLVDSGPYGLMRHPLYTGACMEALGLPIALASWPAALLAAAVFVPLEVHRGYFEEGFLRQEFGDAYLRYANRVWGFLPLPTPRRGRTSAR